MLPTLSAHIKMYDLRPQKRLGQHFLLDTSLCRKIVKHGACDIVGKNILEIGPGPGGLTRVILEHEPKSLRVIEKDACVLPILLDIRSAFQTIPLHIINEDVLRYDWFSDVADDIKFDILSNLPYNISTPILFKCFDNIERIGSMTFMLQRELADRIASDNFSKEYGRISVMVNLLCDVRKCFDIAPSAFFPPPKVWSSVITLVPKVNRPSKVLVKLVSDILLRAFGMRRKMLRTSLSGLHPNIDDMMREVGIICTDRAENISPQQYLFLAELISCRKDILS
jgi:16S rRNA (adenine1518-N6/adenine1519-N6)-dimethyltransferase